MANGCDSFHHLSFKPFCFILITIDTFPVFLWATAQGGGEGNGTPLQYSCLENPMDGGAWWAAVLWGR